MTKDTFYFSHDYNARNDEKVLELRAAYGAEGYGIFWMIIETMAENANGGAKASLIGGLSVAFGVPKERLLGIINFCVELGLFFEKDGFYFSKRLLEHKALRKKLSDKGKEGAEKRRENKEKRLKEAEANTPANGGANRDGISGGNTKERKGKESNCISLGSISNEVFSIKEEELELNISKKEEKKKKEQPLNFPFTSEHFLNKWQEWKVFKAKEHKFNYKSTQSEQAALNLLADAANHTEGVAVEIIQKSIANGWQGLFPIKNTEINNGTKGQYSNNSNRVTVNFSEGQRKPL